MRCRREEVYQLKDLKVKIFRQIKICVIKYIHNLTNQQINGCSTDKFKGIKFVLYLSRGKYYLSRSMEF